MGERKVLNKYFPPDFDPAKLPRGKRAEHNSMKVRMMLPMSVRCNTCGNFMYKGTKFNCKKQDVEGETYLGIQILRFYFRCAHCAAEFILKTDPANTDYVMEKGATRNYEPWRDKEKTVAEAVAQREEEERGNAMKALENRTLDSKREMDIMNALDELKSMSSRHERVDTEAALAALRRSSEEGAAASEDLLDAEDEEAIKQMILQQRGTMVKRLDGSPPPTNGEEPEAATQPEKRKEPEPPGFGMRAGIVKIIHKKKKKADPNGSAVEVKSEAKSSSDAIKVESPANDNGNGAGPAEDGILGLGNYGSESD